MSARFPLAAGTVEAGETAGEERGLVEAAQRLEPEALAALYQHYYPRVYSYAALQVGEGPLAEDIASEVMLRLLESIQRFRFRGVPFRAWVYRIARNRIIDVHRRRRRRGEVALHPGLASRQGDPATAAERELDRCWLRAALERIKPEHRQVIILKFIEGLDNDELARALGRSRGAVKSLQHRALAALRRALGENGAREGLPAGRQGLPAGRQGLPPGRRGGG